MGEKLLNSLQDRNSEALAKLYGLQRRCEVAADLPLIAEAIALLVANEEAILNELNVD
jgi:hypothetical protein